MADDFKKRAYDFFVGKGYPAHQAAALAGNAVWESGGNPTISGDGGKAYGTFQWHPDRQAGLTDFAKKSGMDPTDTNTQLAFADYELNNSESGAGTKLANAKTYAQANDAVLNYLRPSGFTPDNPGGSHGYAGRYNAGADLINATPMTETLATPPTQMVDAGAGANGAMAQDPSTGLLAWGAAQGPQMATQPTGGLLSALADMGKSDAAKQTQTGLGLLAASQPQQQQAPQMQMAQAQVHRPQMQAAAMPNFIDPLLQKKLYGLLGGPA